MFASTFFITRFTTGRLIPSFSATSVSVTDAGPFFGDFRKSPPETPKTVPARRPRGDESRQPPYVVLGDLDDDREKLARAIKQNVIGRDTGEGVKTLAVEQYIETTWDHTDDGDLIRPETDTEVAEKLGVSRQLVTRVIRNANGGVIYHDRARAREYYGQNPDASYREAARQLNASQPTVTEWLNEDFDEGEADARSV